MTPAALTVELARHGARIKVNGEHVSLIPAPGRPLPAVLVEAARAAKADLRVIAGGTTDGLATLLMGLARLDPAHPPGGCSPNRWPAMVTTAVTFAEQWAAKALALGWDQAALFGLDPDAPDARQDGKGLAFIMQPNDRVVALTSEEAIIECPGGARLRFFRQTHSPRSVPAWEIGARND